MPTTNTLWNKHFITFIACRSGLSVVDSLLMVAVGWHLYEATRDAFDLALVGLFQIVPILSLFMVTGWVADHYPRRSILIAGGTLQATVILAIALIMQMPELNKWWLLSALAVYGTGKAFMGPALQTVIPNLVSTQFLSRALAIHSTSWNVALTIGPVLSGVLIAWLDRSGYWLLFLAASMVAVGLWNLPKIGTAGSQAKRPTEWRDLLGGVLFLKNNRTVLGCMSLDLFIVMLGSVMAILPVFVTEVLHEGPETLGLLRAMPAIGSVLVGIALTHRDITEHNTGNTLFSALLVFAGSVTLFACSSNVWLACTALFIYGASDMFSVIIRNAVIQHQTPDELRGRVGGINSIFIASSNQLGDFRAGTVTAWFGPVGGAAIGGLLAFTVAIAGALVFKDLRKLDKIQ